MVYFKINKLIACCFIPILLAVFSSFVLLIKPPYCQSPDPDYVYLLSSLSILNGKVPVHVDHPGTPLQLLGAGIIKVIYEITGSKEELLVDVLSNPEVYLRVINLFLLMVLCLVLILLGFISYKLIHKVRALLLLQLTPFYSPILLSTLYTVRPEPLLLIISTLLVIWVLWVYRQSGVLKPWYFVYVILISGLGLAVKLNFLSLLVIPLWLIRGIFNKGIFLILTFGAFFIFTLPIAGRYNYLKDWIINLFLHTELYGEGPVGIINPSLYLKNLARIIYYDPMPVFISVLFLILLAWLIIPRLKNHQTVFKWDLKVAIGFFMVYLIQILIAAKHYSNHYLIPVLAINGLALFILGDVFNLAAIRPKRKEGLFLILTLGFIIVSLINVSFYVVNLLEYRNIQKAGNDRQCITSAFIFSFPFADELEKITLKQLYPETGKFVTH